MDDILKNLFEIEEQVAALKMDCTRKKNAMNQEAQKEISQYKAEKEVETKLAINALSDELKECAKKKTDCLRNENKEHIEKMENYYKENHKEIVDRIVKEILS